MRTLKVIIALLLLAGLAGCTAARYVMLEARCGLGKDYACGPRSISDFTWVCGCIPKG